MPDALPFNNAHRREPIEADAESGKEHVNLAEGDSRRTPGSPTGADPAPTRRTWRAHAAYQREASPARLDAVRLVKPAEQLSLEELDEVVA